MDSVTKTQRNVNPQVNPYADKITVTGIYPTRQDGTVKAFVNFKIGDALEIFGAKIIPQAGQKAWVTMPDHPRTDGKGYAPYVKLIDDRLKEAISAVVIPAWQAHAGGAA
jgi:DNA-binding cell septation regulator SpoVG